MEQLELTFIGTGNAFAPGGLCWNGFVANGRYLFEAPPQALMSLHQCGIDPNQLDAVVISHHHGDHLLGLPFLMLHWKYMGRSRPIRIVGPPETEAVVRAITSRVYPGLFEQRYGIDWLEARPGQTVDLAGMALDPVEVKHDERLNVNLGFACRLDGRRLAYTGDSALCEAVLGLARDAEVLVAECSSRDERVPLHMNLVDDIPRVRSAMPAGASLLLSHLATDVDDAGLEGVIAARDRAVYRF
jgi:ribonuclease BN (tRNA processing enzyme)